MLSLEALFKKMPQKLRRYNQFPFSDGVRVVCHAALQILNFAKSLCVVLIWTVLVIGSASVGNLPPRPWDGQRPSG